MDTDSTRRVQRSQLDAALRDAFRRKDELAPMVRHELGENLEEIASGENLRNIIFNLLEWAESHNKTDDVLDGAIEEVPNNQKLLRCRNQTSNAWKWKNYIEGLAEELNGTRQQLDVSLDSHLPLYGLGSGSPDTRPVDDIFSDFLADKSCRLLVLRGKAGSGKSDLLKKWQLTQLRNVHQIYKNYKEARKTKFPTKLPNVPTVLVPILVEVRSCPDKFAMEDFLSVSLPNSTTLTQLVDLSSPNSMYKFIHQPGLELLVLLDALDEIQLLSRDLITPRIDMLKKAVSSNLDSVKWVISVRTDEETLLFQLTGVLDSTHTHYRIIDLCDLELNHVASYVRAKLRQDQTDEDVENHGELLTNVLLQSPLGKLVRIPMWLAVATNYLVTEWLVGTDISFTNSPLANYLESCINKIIIRELAKCHLPGGASGEIMFGLSNLAYEMEYTHRDYCISVHIRGCLGHDARYELVPFQIGIMLKDHDEQRVRFSEICLQLFYCAKAVLNVYPSEINEMLTLVQKPASRSGWIWAFLLDRLAASDYPDQLAAAKAFLFQTKYLDIIVECFLHTPAYIWATNKNRTDLLRVLCESAALNIPEIVPVWLRLIQFAKDEDLIADLFEAAYNSQVPSLSAEAMERLTSLTFLSNDPLTDQTIVSATRIKLLQATLDYLKSDAITSIQQLSELFDTHWLHILDAVQVAEPSECLAILNLVQSWIGAESVQVAELIEILRARGDVYNE